MSLGLFSIKDSQLPSLVKGKHKSCASCGLSLQVLNGKMKPYGNFKKHIMNIGEAPGEVEDRRGRPWQGKIGKLLQRTYNSLGIDLFDDCINLNSINCRPTDEDGNNRAPTNDEIACCRQRVFRAIEKYQPKVVILFGFSPVISVIGSKWHKGLDNISKWVGWKIPDREFNTWVCPVFHPGYVERGEEHIATIWKEQLKRALRMQKQELPEFRDESKCVEILENSGDICSAIFEMKDAQKPMAFDYETTGLKPHDKKAHQIVCLSICNSEDKAYVFMFETMRPHLEAYRMLMLDEKVPKIAHNIPHEDRWTKTMGKTRVKKWFFDTMLATHILDNRRGINSLKFQTYVNFGVADYDSAVSKYLKPKIKNNGNSTNNILELTKTEHGRRTLMTYCGMDSIFTLKLANIELLNMAFNNESECWQWIVK